MEARYEGLNHSGLLTLKEAFKMMAKRVKLWLVAGLLAGAFVIASSSDATAGPWRRGYRQGQASAYYVQPRQTYYAVTPVVYYRPAVAYYTPAVYYAPACR